MNKIFEKRNQENNKKIEKLQANIAKAESMIEKLQPKLKYDTDIEEYVDISVKINAYKEIIEKNKEQIEYILNNPYTEEDCIKVRDEIQKEYNSKFKKIYSDIYNQVKKIINSLDEYKEVTENFIDERNELNNNANRIGITVNVYDGEGIKNDYYSEYRAIENELKRLVERCNVQ